MPHDVKTTNDSLLSSETLGSCGHRQGRACAGLSDTVILLWQVQSTFSVGLAEHLQATSGSHAAVASSLQSSLSQATALTEALGSELSAKVQQLSATPAGKLPSPLLQGQQASGVVSGASPAFRACSCGTPQGLTMLMQAGKTWLETDCACAAAETAPVDPKAALQELIEQRR